MVATTTYGDLTVKLRINQHRNTKPNRQFAGGKPGGITLHETSNLFAPAAGNAAYYSSGRQGQTSVHFFVDRREWWQSLPLSEQSWSAGDGRGGCDVHLAALEVCVDNDPVAAWRNAIRGVRELRAAGVVGDELNFHHDCSGKWCPALLLQRPNVYRDVVARDGRGRIRDAQGRTNRFIAVLRAKQLADAGLTEASVLAAIRAPRARDDEADARAELARTAPVRAVEAAGGAKASERALALVGTLVDSAARQRELAEANARNVLDLKEELS